jgi:ubiquinone/menaquinone biosynthesis C-methylase UbiE
MTIEMAPKIIVSIGNWLFLLLNVVNSIVLSPIIIIAHLWPTFGRIYYYYMIRLASYFVIDRIDHAIRSQLFTQIKEEQDKRGSTLKILEIGPGTGGSFAHYPEGSKLTTLELNSNLEKDLMNIRHKYPNISLESNLLGNIENVKDVIPDESFDVVIGLHLICCVHKRLQALKEIRRILKSDGKYFSLEMVYFEPSSSNAARIFQKVYCRIHRFFGLGCRAGSLEMEKLLKEAHFDVSQMKRQEVDNVPLPYSLAYSGFATKDLTVPEVTVQS